MKEYRVCFTQHYFVTVTADNEDEAINLAADIVHIDYDDVEVWENE